MAKDIVFCDNCAEVIFNNKGKKLLEFHEYTEAPFNGESFNEGESAIVCHNCDSELSLRGTSLTKNKFDFESEVEPPFGFGLFC